MKFELASDVCFISIMGGRGKWRVPENYIKSEVSALPNRAFSLFCAITSKAF